MIRENQGRVLNNFIEIAKHKQHPSLPVKITTAE
jgi:hypothetical protein